MNAPGQGRLKGSRAPIRTGLDHAGLRPRALLLPILLHWLATTLRIVVMILWLPLLHGLIQGQFAFSHRLAFLQHLAPGAGGLPDSRTLFLIFGSAVLIVTLIRGCCLYLAKSKTAQLVAKTELVLSQRLLTAYLGFGQRFFDESHPARHARRLQALPRRASKLIAVLIRSAAQGLAVLTYALALFLLSPPLLAAVGGVALVSYLAFRGLVRRVARSEEGLEQFDDRIGLRLGNFIARLPLVRTRLQDQAEMEALRTSHNALLKARAASERRGEIFGSLSQTVTIAAILLVALVASSLNRVPQTADLPRLLIFFLVLRRAASVVMKLLQTPAKLRRSRGAWRRYLRTIKPRRAYIQDQGDLEVPADPQVLEARDLGFGYLEKRPLFEALDLRAERGHLLSLVGATGSGKSTLMKLLARLYDCQVGSVAIDGADIRAFSLASLRPRIAFLGSDPVLFAGSIRDNLTYGLGDVSDARLEQALSSVGLDAYIARLPRGLETQINPRAGGPSHGEAQKLALVPLLLGDATILLVDDAFSNLDPESEAGVLETLERLAADHIVVVAGQHLVRIGVEGRVAFLEGGRIVETGTRAELLARGGPFATYVKAAEQGDNVGAMSTAG